MNITITRHSAPTIPEAIEAALADMVPRVFMRWNSTARRTAEKDSLGNPVWEPRWEIWCELRPSAHPDARNDLAETDEWNTEAQCWMRRLQTYETEEGDFAGIDWGLITGLQMADTWANRRFYEDAIETPYENAEQARVAARKEAIRGSREHYQDFDRTLVGPHGGSGDWRWRTR